MEWFLERLRLTDTEEPEEEPEVELQTEEETGLWFEKYLSQKNKVNSVNQHIFCKKMNTYEDAKEVICEYRAGAECVMVFNQRENADSQGIMNYICGGIYALGGVVWKAGEEVFVVSEKNN